MLRKINLSALGGFSRSVDGTTETEVGTAVDAFRDGTPVLIYDADDREGEVDLVYPASAVDPADVACMRNDAGGLVCVALSADIAEAFDLPFVQDAVDHPAAADHELGYGDRSSFSLTVNYRDTYTGITDGDRALTITKLARAASKPVETDFAAKFRAPGHVHLLRGAPNLLDDREGHTELGLTLASEARLPPAVVVCEMLSSGGALSLSDAAEYAQANDYPLLTGETIINQLG